MNLIKFKKLLLVLTILLSSSLYSQEVYEFKKETLPSKKLIFHCQELDRLVLYKNKTFSKLYSYRCHQIDYLEQKGNWKIENGTLYLETKKENTETKKPNWKKVSIISTYLVKRKKLIPVDYLDNFNQRNKLKRVKNDF